MAALALGELAEIFSFSELPAELAENIGGSIRMWKRTKRVAEIATGGEIVRESLRSAKKQKVDHSSISPMGEKRKNPEVFNNMEKNKRIGANQTSNGEEVPVMPVPRAVAKTAPDYFNTKLPLAFSGRIHTTTGTNIADTAGTFNITLNKLSDPINGFGTHNGRGKTTWASIYKYYRITQCDVKITMFASSIWNDVSGGGDPFTSNRNLYMAGFHLTDDPSLQTWTTYRDFSEAKQGGYNLMRSGTETQYVSQLQYTFRPETWDMHVTESGIEERWTPVSASPADQKYMIVGAVGAHPFGGQGGNDENANVTFLCEIVQHVQFREIIDSIRNLELN